MSAAHCAGCGRQWNGRHRAYHLEQSRNALVSVAFCFWEHGWQQGEAVRQAFILAGVS
ncbi:hypothetical protein [Escherichia coli]|uniref:hypothetical protein n=1 Tax=Escherichia coli TaxID=562 RepID=UPI003F66FB12